MVTAAEDFPRLSARTQRFSLGEPRSFTVCADGSRVLFLRSASGTDPRTGLWCLDLPAGVERPVVDPADVADDGDLPAEERARRERTRENAAGVVAYSADDAGRLAVFSLGGTLHVADIDAATSRQLATEPGAFDPRLDPTGQRVAYVAGPTLRLFDLAAGTDRQLAGDAAEAVSWGRAEHAAAEEMDRFRGFWWAPDGGSLLVTRVDETPVPTWWIADPAHPQRPPVAVRYPAAGSADADVSLHVVNLAGDTTAVEWDRERFPYLGRVHWTAGGPPLLQVMTRDQRTAVVLRVEVATGATTALAEDTDPTWVELFPGVPAWAGDQLVRIVDSGDVRALSVGDRAVSDPALHVRGVAAASADGVVFTGSTDDPMQVHVFRWSAEHGVEQLTDDEGVHAVTGGLRTTVLTSSTMTDSRARHVVRRDGAEWVLDNRAERPDLVPEVALLRLGERRVAAGLLVPRGHRAGTPLPVLLASYAGPHVQRVLASRRYWLEPQWFADQGFAVLVVDGRGTPGRGPRWEREISRDLPVVLDDQIDALRAAARLHPDLDLTRVAIRGWSFGGYLAALAVLRRPDVFHAAVAGAPVTDWSLYDTFYTERYLGRPEDDPEAYARASLLDAAAALTRPLMLVHGLADDNVVSAHTLLLSQRLTEQGRPHTVLPLSGVTHMTPQESVAENLLLLQVQFLKEALSLKDALSAP